MITILDKFYNTITPHNTLLDMFKTSIHFIEKCRDHTEYRCAMIAFLMTCSSGMAMDINESKGDEKLNPSPTLIVGTNNNSEIISLLQKIQIENEEQLLGLDDDEFEKRIQEFRLNYQEESKIRKKLSDLEWERDKHTWFDMINKDESIQINNEEELFSLDDDIYNARLKKIKSLYIRGQIRQKHCDFKWERDRPLREAREREEREKAIQAQNEFSRRYQEITRNIKITKVKPQVPHIYNIQDLESDDIIEIKITRDREVIFSEHSKELQDLFNESGEPKGYIG